jgi:hypothetical protein
MQTISSARHTGKREPARNHLLEAALEYAGRGWRVFPLHSPTVAGCSCGNRNCGKSIGKHPRTAHGLQDACTDAAKISVWWERWPDANIGIATGPESGVFVLDIDGELGDAALSTHHRQGRNLPDTLTVSTGRGKHIYFRWPEGQTIRNSAGKLAKGLDIRGDRGYAVIPPSIHQTGARYAYIDPNASISDAPAWLLALVAQPFHAGVSILCEGHRNDGLIRLAGAWRRGGASQDEIERRLQVENVRRCRPPLPDAEVIKIAASAARYPVGGPDPLERAWQCVLAEPHNTTYQKLLALARHLQIARPGLPIALPLVRIGEHMGCDWTLVRRYRQRAESKGLIVQVKPYVAKRMAALFDVPDPSKTGVPLTGPPCTTNSPTS